MKKSEFKRKIEDLGFHIETDKYGRVKIFTDIDYDDYFMAIGILGTGDLSVEADSLGETEKYAKAVKLAVDYAFTPLADREDEPKQYAIHLFSGHYGYLNYDKSKGVLTTTIADVWNEAYQCLFTKEEYNEFREAEMQAGFTTLPEFDLENRDVFVPVEADE